MLVDCITFQINALKRMHRDAMIDLLRKQLNEQLELAEKQLTPVCVHVSCQC